MIWLSLISPLCIPRGSTHSINKVYLISIERFSIVSRQPLPKFIVNLLSLEKQIDYHPKSLALFKKSFRHLYFPLMEPAMLCNLVHVLNKQTYHAVSSFFLNVICPIGYVPCESSVFPLRILRKEWLITWPLKPPQLLLCC